MELVIRLILILASIDFILTLFWIYRWKSSGFLEKFKLRIPSRVVEANPIINHTIKNYGLYPGTIMGYSCVLLIQIALASLHNIIGWIVVIILVLAILSHIKNNITTTNGYIIKMTRAYNKKMGEKN